jgi:hypothetical protein
MKVKTLSKEFIIEMIKVYKNNIKIIKSEKPLSENEKRILEYYNEHLEEALFECVMILDKTISEFNDSDFMRFRIEQFNIDKFNLSLSYKIFESLSRVYERHNEVFTKMNADNSIEGIVVVL